MSAIRYRADIDGLRAVAVLVVLLFHARLGPFPGGFVGVDVFFVISGYLITSIILAEIEAGTFSIVHFYERRVRRILPALFTVIAASIAIGWFVLAPRDYMEFALSAAAAAALYSNFHFNTRAGYFAPAAETQPLLHTWSIGVEEQFYLLAPLVILLLAGRLRLVLLPAVAGLGLVSLAVAAYGVEQEWSSAFYLLPARAWELLVGVALAFGLAPRLASRGLRNAAGLAGLACIATAALLYRSGMAFPGFAALIPCLGTALLIESGREGDTLTHRLLAAPPLVYLGRISYSLYLWHWPLLVFAEYELGAAFGDHHRLAVLALSVALSVASYTFIEQPVRRRQVLAGRRGVFAAALGGLLACLGATELIRSTRGLPGRLSPEAAAFARAAPDKSQLRDICAGRAAAFDGEDTRGCEIGARREGPASFVLYGDSHAAAVSHVVSEIAAGMGLKGYAVLTGGCPPLLGLERVGARTFRKCIPPGRQIARIAADPAVRNVIVVGRWGLYAEGQSSPNETGSNVRRFVAGDQDANRAAFRDLLTSSVEQLAHGGRTITLVGPVPELPFNLPAAMTRAAMRDRRQDFSLPYADFEQRQRSVFAALGELARRPGVRVLYPHRLLCSPERCRTVDEGRLLYFDDDHLSQHGVRAIAEILRSALAE
jgi:peptidoglycan/LPS O-acetylase OafA/YrhL